MRNLYKKLMSFKNGSNTKSKDIVASKTTLSSKHQGYLQYTNHSRFRKRMSITSTMFRFFVYYITNRLRKYYVFEQINK